MRARDKELLRATAEAADILTRFPVGNRTSFDVVGAVIALEIPLLFRPLRKLWGAAITVGTEAAGIVVTSKLGRHVQRFTLAHELGHLLLGHEMSFDETVSFLGRFSSPSRPIIEQAADTFAAELLTPRNLMLDAAQRHGWTRARLSDPANIYQMGLRLGVSYKATCWALAAKNVITRARAGTLQNVEVKGVKHALAPERLMPHNWADVWLLTENDTGTRLEAGRDDIFALHVQDMASSGYVWRLVDAGDAADILEENTTLPDSYGATSSRVIHLRFKFPGVHVLRFEHARPWNKQRIGEIEVTVDGRGKETPGLPRRLRSAALGVGVA